MSALFDVLGFFAVVLQGAAFIAQSVLIGSAVFALVVVPVWNRSRQPRAERDVERETLVVVRIAAAATVALAIAMVLLTIVMLTTSLGLGVRDVVGATFVIAGAAKGTAAIALAACAMATRWPLPIRRTACAAVIAMLLAAAVAESHAIARLEHVVPLVIATAAHELGAALWLGGLPCLWLALRDSEPSVARGIGRRYSLLAASGVAAIAVGAVVFSRFYIGSVDALYGTAYGAMAGVKAVLLALLLALGFRNFRILRGRAPDAVAVLRVRRIVEVEIFVGVAVLMAAASLASSPASIDVVADRVSLPELARRLAPVVPTFASPDTRALAPVTAEGAAAAARTAGDRAWSEYNHHVAGLAVALIGVAALLSRRAKWAAHWPLLLLLLAAFLVIRADPEVWPLGPIGPIASLRDPEVVQHRLFVVLIAAFAWIEWPVQRHAPSVRNRARVFPLLMVIGGALLLTHSHAVGDAKEQLLIELTHLPIAILGVVAGSARWLEVTAPQGEERVAGWIWPVALLLVGLLLLDYREG